jgi:hypothetical protein
MNHGTEVIGLGSGGLSPGGKGGKDLGRKGENSGQLYVIDPVFSIDCGWLGTPFFSHHFLAVKQFLTQLSFPG